MIILTLRTDKPVAELGLYDGQKQLTYKTWEAHRQLAETIHSQIATLLQLIGKDMSEIEGVVAFQGPGSFTGLRIGMSVANALSYSLELPIVASQTDDWIETGIKRLLAGESDTTAQPEYGSPVHITLPRK